MKAYRNITAIALAISFLTAPIAGFAAEEKAKKAKPYPLDTCVVTGEKLDAMGKPVVFVHEGQEIKLCCKGCMKEFKKDTAKYLKKIQDAQKPK